MRVKPLFSVSNRTELTDLDARHLDPCNAYRPYVRLSYFVHLSVDLYVISAGGFGVWEDDTVSSHPWWYFVRGHSYVGAEHVA